MSKKMRFMLYTVLIFIFQFLKQSKAQVTQLEENQRQISDAVKACESAIASGDPTSVPQFALDIRPEFREAIVKSNGQVQFFPFITTFINKKRGIMIYE